MKERAEDCVENVLYSKEHYSKVQYSKVRYGTVQ